MEIKEIRVNLLQIAAGCIPSGYRGANPSIDIARELEEYVMEALPEPAVKKGKGKTSKTVDNSGKDILS